MPGIRPALSCGTLQAGLRLENNFQPELGVERFSRSYSRRPVVISDGVGYKPETVARGIRGWSEVLAVEDVEELGAELDFYPLSNISRLEHGKIHIFKARTKELIAPGCSREGSDWTIRERVWIDPALLLVH